MKKIILQTMLLFFFSLKIVAVSGMSATTPNLCFPDINNIIASWQEKKEVPSVLHPLRESCDTPGRGYHSSITPLSAAEIRLMEVEYIQKGLVGFPFRRIVFTDEMKERLEFLAYWLKENPNAKLELTSHTCNLGRKKQNKEVAFIRAQTVKEYLVMRGVEASRITKFSKGHTNPLAPNNCDENRFMNRRVEFKIVE